MEVKPVATRKTKRKPLKALADTFRGSFSSLKTIRTLEKFCKKLQRLFCQTISVVIY